MKARILEREKDLAAEIETAQGPLLSKLRDTLPPERPAFGARIAAVVWALGLDDPRRHVLFRFLPLLAPEPSVNLDEKPVQAGPRPFQEKERHRRRRLKAEARVDELVVELDRVRSTLRERSQELRVATEALDAARSDIEEERETARGCRDDLNAALNRADAAERSLRTVQGEARRSEQANSSLRQAQIDLEKRLNDSERDRRRVATALASANARREEAEAALRAVPRGTEAVAKFLDEEEDRLDQALVILQGGDRQRAEEQHARHQKLKKAFRAAFPQYVPPRPRSIGEAEELHFRALGGGAEVGRSAYLVEIGASRVLVDCGIAVGRDLDEAIPDIEGLGPLDAIVITHAHTDHVGWLPALITSQSPVVPIYCSEATAELTPIMLRDAHNHYMRDRARKRHIAAYNPYAAPIHEHYTGDDVVDVETRLHALRYDDRTDGPAGLAITLFPAGHILGAASVLIEKSDRRVLVSGDISSRPQATVNAPTHRADLDPVDLLVLESTYGAKRRPDIGREEIIRFVRETTQHGTALLPCFALGRGQEVLKILLDARATGAIDRDVTFWVDGLIREILPVFTERGLVPDDGYEMVGTSGCTREIAIGDCQRVDARAAVITTSGMLNGGPVVAWADALLRDSRHRLALLGYQDGESSLGGRLRELHTKSHPPYDVTLTTNDGDETPLRINGPVCDISLSAHADQDGLVQFARAISARQVALVHGDPESQEELATRLSTELRDVHVHCPGSHRITIP